VEKGKYSNRYTILHGRRKRKIENVKPDKLFPYHPWSEQVPTTSPCHEHNLRNYEVGTRCEKDSLFIVPLNRPHPFGVGKAINTDDIDNIKFQWLEPAMNDCDALGPFQPMWINAEHTETYIAKEPIKDTDMAYTNDIAGIEVAQRDIILHGFSLTEDEKIPQDVLDACTEHNAIAYGGHNATTDANASLTRCAHKPDLRNRAETSSPHARGAHTQIHTA